MFRYLVLALVFGVCIAENDQRGGYHYEQVFSRRSGSNGLELSGGLSGLKLSNGLGNRVVRRKSYSLDEGLSLGKGLDLSLGNSYSLGSDSGLGHSPGPIRAAIHTRRTYRVIPVHTNYEPAIPQLIEVEPTYQPVHVLFRSASSPVIVKQLHTPGAPGHTEATKSEDEPHRVLHEILRPVIQEVREVIQPLRRVVQEIKPVVEEVHTVVAKGEGRESRGELLADSGLALGGGYGAAHGGSRAINLRDLGDAGLKGGALILDDNDLGLADSYSTAKNIELTSGLDLGKGLTLGGYRAKAAKKAA